MRAAVKAETLYPGWRHDLSHLLRNLPPEDRPSWELTKPQILAGEWLLESRGRHLEAVYASFEGRVLGACYFVRSNGRVAMLERQRKEKRFRREDLRSLPAGFLREVDHEHYLLTCDQGTAFPMDVSTIKYVLSSRARKYLESRSR